MWILVGLLISLGLAAFIEKMKNEDEVARKYFEGEVIPYRDEMR